MNFTVYPAIDLRGGRCVRLFQGDYDQETVYQGSPASMARRWEAEGAPWIHVVDLDAAKTGEPVNLSVIRDIVGSVDIPVQVGGGVRDAGRLETLLDMGVSRVVIGSAAIDDPEFVEKALGQYGDRVALGLDARDGRVATHGWLEVSEILAEDLGKEMVALGAETFIFTDISRDGTLTGPNIPAVRSLAMATGKQVIASGGVKNVGNLVELARFRDEGVAGAIVGKALYTGDVDLKEALNAIRERNES
ncbi:1-(5-phosphoribosyl)-5-[(5-phosphoribosylamino)methylideneamino] imidazole-4-carboxamide isomerase [Melghirimyces profundicolus]|uniref:1-(5-phosphoribosyl)-5-[(5-phosphoribosylamino)methylideneamino] imidazole-4-carboxamide isomerase n=1 Tax=Melghirimyces profundicolus TaxID=1242148 RepID=A0A2T6BU75_9BACL|nr:1-(5-phosphoribosyl)-5-[(5-phosphoribosylamino)methylideneamino]imidazole-4-carboxamide isomerase [Melghirimyces profundicolus]PTX59631.1 1-(5-phosphoribosyl)-5-[(5-phosphoribosylamino)methylideneamino] imidazole-4-carboxamide isomerase [Melghirimyces profundicolus]